VFTLKFDSQAPTLRLGQSANYRKPTFIVAAPGDERTA
jgi:hypothetical protein